MARKILGKVLNQENGSPVAGARVQAWDSDWPDTDDFMGSAITGTDGSYNISYAGGHWDTAPHNITTWRPDIYLIVDVRNSAGQWIRAKKTSVHSDHKLREDLRIDVHINPPNPYARTVYGYIKWQDNGLPVVDARVTAYDQDTVILGRESERNVPGNPGPPSSGSSYTVRERLEPMGGAVTDSNGYYEIHYAGGEWDFALPGSTWWRPDILIKVFAEGREWRSAIHDDVPHRSGVRIDMHLNRPRKNR